MLNDDNVKLNSLKGDERPCILTALKYNWFAENITSFSFPGKLTDTDVPPPTYDEILRSSSSNETNPENGIQNIDGNDENIIYHTSISSSGEISLSPSYGDSGLSPSYGDSGLSPSYGDSGLSPSYGDSGLSPSSDAPPAYEESSTSSPSYDVTSTLSPSYDATTPSPSYSFERISSQETADEIRP